MNSFKQLLATAIVALITTGAAQAELKFKGVAFEPPQPISGKSGKAVQVSSTLYGRYYNTETRKNELLPLPGANITYEAARSTTSSGKAVTNYGPVGSPAMTDAAGVTRANYRLPSGAKQKLQGRYRAVYAGGVVHGVVVRKVYSTWGTVIINK
jgi:hypothetical protein